MNRRHKHRQRTQDRNNHIVSSIEFTYDLPIDGLLAVAYGILVAFLAIALCEKGNRLSRYKGIESGTEIRQNLWHIVRYRVLFKFRTGPYKSFETF